MPLRDHFRKPISKKESWEGVHSLWPGVIVQQLNPILQPRYFAVPQVHLGSFVEIDIATFESEDHEPEFESQLDSNGGGTALWSPPQPTTTLDSEFEKQSEYEVMVYDAEQGERLVAAIELVSPANKDRPEHRRAFVSKCAALLWQEVSVIIVDVVTVRSPNLFRAVWEEVGGEESKMRDASIYAVSLKPSVTNGRLKVKTWEHELQIGQKPPTLPLWLQHDFSIPLDLDASYESACRTLGIR